MNPTPDYPTGALKPLATARRTVIGEQRVTWCLSRQSIRILQVHTETGTLLTATGPFTAPDLANMREWFPELTPLWDAVRQQFWSQVRREGTAG